MSCTDFYFVVYSRIREKKRGIREQCGKGCSWLDYLHKGDVWIIKIMPSFNFYILPSLSLNGLLFGPIYAGDVPLKVLKVMPPEFIYTVKSETHKHTKTY